MIGFDRKFMSAQEQEADDRLLEMKESVKKAQENNPFVIYEATGADLIYAVFDIAKNKDGVQLEKAFGIIGALAGFSCAIVAALRSEAVSPEERAAGNHMLIPNNTGQTMYCGRFIEDPLLQNDISFYRIIAGKAAVMGDTCQLDLAEVFHYHSCQIGAANFGIPRMPVGRCLNERPIDFVIEHWPDLLPILTRYDDAFVGWPTSLGAAGGQLMQIARDAMPAPDAIQIMMECAVPMSKIGPSHLQGMASPEAA